MMPLTLDSGWVNTNPKRDLGEPTNPPPSLTNKNQPPKFTFLTVREFTDLKKRSRIRVSLD